MKIRIAKNARAAALTSPTHTFSDLNHLDEGQISELFRLGEGSPIRIHDSPSVGEAEREAVIKAAQAAGIELQLINEESEKARAAREILDEILKLGPDRFAEFCLSLPPQLWIDEWNQFAVGHEVSRVARDYAELHYWDNIGFEEGESEQEEVDGEVEQEEAEGEAKQEEVEGEAEQEEVEGEAEQEEVEGEAEKRRAINQSGVKTQLEVLTFFMKSLELCEMIHEKIVPHLDDHAHIKNPGIITWGLCLSMLSNAVRGLLYWSMGKSSDYIPRCWRSPSTLITGRTHDRDLENSDC